MIVFHDDVKKAPNAPDVALLKLRRYLDTKEPQLVKFLQVIWDKQQRAITYKEIRESIMRGYLTEEMLEEWHKDYSRFVVQYVAPMWKDAMKAATEDMEKRFDGFTLDLAGDGIRQWTDKASASFVTRVVNDQKLAIQEVVRRAAVMQDMNVDELSRVIRPMVGLNYPQAVANMNYYQKMLDSGVSKKLAKERCIRYSARQSRYRGYMIARTELAFAYNQGEYLGIQQAISQGLMGHTRKVWCTADDERVCEICGGLEGRTIEMEEDFDFSTKLKYPGIKKSPPAHPQCRCSVLYEEVSPPDYASIVSPTHTAKSFRKIIYRR